MRTAIVSDLHLGGLTGEDLLRDRAIRNVLFEEVRGADRLVLLGDTIELRDLPVSEALERSRPFFAELGEVLAGREVVIVAGNHDHRLAEPLVDRRELAAKSLGLANEYRPAGAAAKPARWLGETQVRLSYPGFWVRDDVFAMHGHYADCHLTLPRLECIAAAAVMRGAGPIPDPADADDYERILRPVYGLTYGLAQSGLPRMTGGGTRASERAWTVLSARGSGALRRRLAGAAVKAGVPAVVWALNRSLRSEFDPDLSARAIAAAGIAASTEVVRRLRIEAAHVITGHTHRAGPMSPDSTWPIEGGGLLHNTGNWIFTPALHRPGSRPGPFWPGTVTWVEDEDPPRRVSLLADRDTEELGRIARGGRFRLAALASSELG